MRNKDFGVGAHKPAGVGGGSCCGAGAGWVGGLFGGAGGAGSAGGSCSGGCSLVGQRLGPVVRSELALSSRSC